MAATPQPVDPAADPSAEDGMVSLADLRAAAERRGPRSFTEIVGRCLDAKQVRHLLKLSRSELAARRDEGDLIAVSGKKRTEIFPAWQFDRTAAAVRPAVKGVICAFDEHLHEIDDLLIASWATSQNVRDLDGRTPAQWIEAGGSDERVVAAARRTAVRLAW